MSGPDEAAQLRDRLLRSLLLGFTGVGVPALFVNVYVVLRNGWSTHALFYVLCYLVVLALLLMQARLGFRVAALVLVGLVWVLALAALARFGLAGGGLLALTAMAVISTALFGLRGGYAALGLSVLSMAVLGTLFALGRISTAPELVRGLDGPVAWIAMGTVFLLFALLDVYGPGHILTHTQRLVKLLEERTSELEATNRRLTEEMAERKKAEAARNALEGQLRHAHKMEAVGQLAGGVAHDFNNLLLAIRGNTELALLRLPPDSPVMKQLEAIDKTTERGSHLTRQLLALSRKQVVELKTLSLPGFLRDMEPVLTGFLGEGIGLTVRLGSRRDLVRADRSSLQQVLLNLASNARDAMPNGGRLVVELTDERIESLLPGWILRGQSGAHIKLTVSDTGGGMDASVRERAFEPFFSTKPKDKGTGLGLAIVYGILRQHQASLDVQTETGKGTTVSIWLPAVAPDAGFTADEPTSEVALPGQETLLVVEDEPEGRAAIVGLLESLGYGVHEAGTAADAKRIAEEQAGRIDLLVTDVVLPDGNGREVADVVMGISPRTRVLFISGYTEDQVLRHGVFAREVRFLAKPFTRTRLSQKVREALAETDED